MGKKGKKNKRSSSTIWYNGEEVLIDYIDDEECPKCGTLPTKPWSREDLDTWDMGICPKCQHALSNVAGGAAQKTAWGGDYDYGYGAYYGTGKGGYVKGWKTCDHAGDPVELLPGVSMFGYSSRATKGLPDVDYFIALASNWADDGDGLLITPGTPLTLTTLHPTGPKYVYLATPDRGTVQNLGLFVEIVEWAVNQAMAGKRVGVGCVGGHGRTGTFLSAALLVANPSWTAKDAVEYLRKAYCDDAVESESQVDLLVALATHVWTDKPKSDDPIAAAAAYIAEEDAKRAAERKKKGYTAYSAASQNSGPFPKRVRIKSNLTGDFGKDVWGLEVTVIGWGHLKGAVTVVRPNRANEQITFMESEYVVTEPADPVKKDTLTGRWIRCKYAPYHEYKVLRRGATEGSVVVTGISCELVFLAAEFEFIPAPKTVPLLAAPKGVVTFPGKITRVIKP